jgi:hypothetical protein
MSYTPAVVDESVNESRGSVRPENESEAAVVAAAPADKLEGVEDIDFLLEEIENKIAPLALA